MVTMDFIKSNLSAVGAFLLGAGIISIVLAILFHFNIASIEVRLLLWIDMWGEEIGWLIRMGVTALGAALFFFGKKSAVNDSE